MVGFTLIVQGNMEGPGEKDLERLTSGMLAYPLIKWKHFTVGESLKVI